MSPEHPAPHEIARKTTFFLAPLLLFLFHGFLFHGLLHGAPVGAQSSAPDAVADTAFEERIDVELVDVRVWVSDRDGRPVPGLDRDDFTVEIDGEPVPLTHFAESRRGEITRARSVGVEPILSDPSAVETSTPETSVGEAPDSGPSAETPGRFIIYLDELHTSLRGRRQIIEDLRRQVAEEELPAAEILILQQVHDLRIVLPFGASEEEVDAALESLLEAPGDRGLGPREKRRAVDRIWEHWEKWQTLAPRDPCSFFSVDASQEASVYSRRSADRARTTLGHLEEASSFLAGVEGFKAVLYIGDLLEVRPGEDLLQIVHRLCPGYGDTLPSEIASEELSDRFDRAAQRANAGQVTIYTLQASGLETSGFGGADQRSADIRTTGAFEGAARASDRGGLEQIAQQTGGEAFVNRNRFVEAIGDVAEDLVSYYTLAFSPPADRRDEGYRLDIRVRGDGLRVRHRDRVQLRSPRQQMEEQVMSAIYLGESRNPLGVRLASGTLREEGEGVFVLPLFVRVPADAVTFLPGAEGETAELAVMIATRSPERRGMPAVTRVYRVQRPEEEGRLLDLAMELQLAPGVYVLGVGVRDRAVAEGSFVSTSIAVGPIDDP